MKDDDDNRGNMHTSTVDGPSMVSILANLLFSYNYFILLGTRLSYVGKYL